MGVVRNRIVCIRVGLSAQRVICNALTTIQRIRYGNQTPEGVVFKCGPIIKSIDDRPHISGGVIFHRRGVVQRISNAGELSESIVSKRGCLF